MTTIKNLLITTTKYSPPLISCPTEHTFAYRPLLYDNDFLWYIQHFQNSGMFILQNDRLNTCKTYIEKKQNEYSSKQQQQ